MNLRELLWLVAGKQREDWGHTSALLAKLHNCHVSRRSHVRRPEDFNPVWQRERQLAWRGARRNDVQRLKSLLIKTDDRHEAWRQRKRSRPAPRS